MEKINYVSIWLARFDCYEELREYIQEVYTDDGDQESQFMKDFMINYYDEDFREADFLEEGSSSFSELLKDYSYYKSIISNYTNCKSDKLKRAYNSVILLYDYKYEGEVNKKEYSNKIIEFIGGTEYDKNE